MTKPFKFFVKESEVTPYSPLNHTGTVNRRLIGPKETGSENLEVLLGAEPGHRQLDLPGESAGLVRVLHQVDQRHSLCAPCSSPSRSSRSTRSEKLKSPSR